MGKKSRAQIARMELRAAARGEEYIPPSDVNLALHDPDSIKLAAAKKLIAEVKRIDEDPNLKAKDRRSAKRRAEAISLEESGCSSEQLLEWYRQQGDSVINEEEESKKESNAGNDENIKMKGKKSIPYILFIGQLSFKTSKDELFNHIKKELGKEFDISTDTVRIRLLTEPKTKKSRGMAFLETADPDLMYACLKLHHTYVGDRRINVERSSGGRKVSDTRVAKIKQYREQQDTYFSEVVNRLINGYVKSGEMREGELDEGAIALCKRHSITTVEATLTRYLEMGGRNMDNPSAFFAHLIGKIATEGLIESDRKERRGEKLILKETPRKRKSSTPEIKDGEASKISKVSEFSRIGIDMRVSERNGTSFSNIFQSMTRGRGR
jgi:RNA recognition motif-containing protein